ncbi:MAG: DUF1800 family protein [Bdellovibrionales bacterium]|nr:DUF1800 family protein [Bdellovibrionales bacterium]
MKRYRLALFVCAAIFSMHQSAYAAKKNKKAPPALNYQQVDEKDIFEISIDVQVKSKKKKNKKKKGGSTSTKKINVQCLDTTPGETSSQNGQLSFLSYNDKIRGLKAQIKQQLRKGKRPTALTSQLKEVKSRLTSAKSKCVRPPFLSLDKYEGPWTSREAQILLRRAGYDISPERVQEAVRDGMDRTIDKLMTYNSNSAFEGVRNDIWCDGYRSDGSDARNRECNPNNPLDFEVDGIRHYLYLSIQEHWNDYFNKLMLNIFYSRSMTAGFNEVSSYFSHPGKHFIAKYVRHLEESARSGDFKAYLKPLFTAFDQVEGEFDAGVLPCDIWLDNRDNIGESPNENCARELWELASVGTEDRISGTPNYSRQDISQAALALSGRRIRSRTLRDENGEAIRWSNGDSVNVWYGTWDSNRHRIGPKLIFAGLPNQAEVFDARDVYEATIRHPHLPTEIAFKLWKEYVSPQVNSATLRQLSQIIAESDLNVHPAMRKIFQSRALYNPENERRLESYPIDYYFKLQSILKIPFFFEGDGNAGSDLEKVDSILSTMGQLFGYPDTVFGFHRRELLNDSTFLKRWNILVQHVFDQEIEDLQEQHQFNYWGRFLYGLPEDGADEAFIKRLENWFGCELNDSQHQELSTYLNYRRKACNYEDRRDGFCEEGDEYWIQRDKFDPHPDKTNLYQRVIGALLAFAHIPQCMLLE